MYLLSVTTLLQKQQQAKKLSPQKSPHLQRHQETEAYRIQEEWHKTQLVPYKVWVQNPVEFHSVSVFIDWHFWSVCHLWRHKRRIGILTCLKEGWQETAFSKAVEILHVTALLLCLADYCHQMCIQVCAEHSETPILKSKVPETRWGPKFCVVRLES